MKRSLIVFVALGLMAGLVGCGGSGINMDSHHRTNLINEFLYSNPEVDAGVAGCIIDHQVTALERSYAAADIGEGLMVIPIDDVDDRQYSVLVWAAEQCGYNWY
tara:strand:+ start:83 stop:394 length:312 start_codon:yes stop_codon:yes gene_type:complete